MRKIKPADLKQATVHDMAGWFYTYDVNNHWVVINKINEIIDYLVDLKKRGE